MAQFDEPTWLRNTIRVLRVALSGIALAGFFGFCVWATKGFIPSVDHVEYFSPWANSLIVVTLPCLVLITFAAGLKYNRGEAGGQDLGSPGKALFSIVGGWILLAVLTEFFVFCTVPMLRSFLQGERTVLTYSVRQVSNGHSAECPNSFNVEGMRVLIGEICGMPRSETRDARAGSRIVIEGWGTKSGIFYDGVRINE